jgi:hypothetical protein
MRRREFSLLGCLLVGLPLAGRAQQSAKIACIGWMSRGTTVHSALTTSLAVNVRLWHQA